MATGFAPAAHAQLSWREIGTLSVGGSHTFRTKVAMAPNGEAVAVWERSPVIDGTYRPAGGNFVVPGPQISNNLGSDNPEVAIGTNGHGQAVWSSTDGSHSRAAGAHRAPGGPFGGHAFLSPAGDHASEPPVAAVAPPGNALGLYRREIWEYVQATTRVAGSSTWSSSQQLSTESGPFQTTSGSPAVAMDPQGNAVAAWLRNANNNGVVEARWRNVANGVWEGVNTLSAPGAPGGARAAMDGQGGALVVWVGVGNVPGAAYRAPGAGKSFVNQPVPGPGSAISAPRVAMDAAGNGIMVWLRGGRVEAAVRPAGGSFSAGTPISAAGAVAHEPEIAMSSNGSALVVWRQAGQDDRIFAAHRAAGGSFGAPFELTDPDAPGDAVWPDVAMDAAGNAIATWSRNQDGTIRVQSRIGVVPGTPPPPPPPPPPPEPPPPPPDPGVPTVTAVRLAEPLARDRAVVMTADVAGPVERLEWDLPVGANIVGRTFDGGLQRSVRFRPPSGPWSVRVRAHGAGRAGPLFTRNLASLRPSQDSDTQRVLARRGSVAVAAVGDAASLTGRSSRCTVPTMIQAGRLELEGCLRPAEKLADIPAVERGVLDSIAREMRLPVTDSSLMNRAIELSDGYISPDAVKLDGGWPIVPRGAASLVAFPQANALASSNAGLKVGGHHFGPPGGFVLNINPRVGEVPLPALPRPPSLRDLGGFPLVGDFDVKLVGGEAHISSTLKLPGFLKKAGVDVQAAVRLRATPDRLIVDDMTIGPMNVDIGALAVNQFRIAYRREGAGDLWHGQGKACVISGICLDMIPPNGQVKIKDGRLDFAGASLGFGRPGIPLFTGVNLERIGFGFGLNPTRFTGNARLTFSQVLVVDGRIVLAFPTAHEPFFLRRDEVGNDFPAHLYTYRYTGPTFGASAAAALRVPVVGEVPLAQAYVLYEYPSYLALGGGMSYAFREPLTGVVLIGINGRVDGEFNARNGRFNVDGRVEGCVVDVICRGFEGNVSSRGMAVCGKVNALLHEFHAGGAVRWSPFKFIPYLDGCVWGRFREPNVRGARAARAGRAYRVQVAPGAPSRMVMIEGRDGAPRVRVTGPAGQTLESPEAPGLVGTRDAKIRILRSPKAKFAAVALAGARPGTYSIEAMEGSVPIGRIQESTALRAARVRGRVRGSGTRRFLEYAVARRPDQVVTFHDVGANRAARQIGTVRGGGRGRLAFAPVPGRARRTIKARFEIDGVPAEERVVASFRPPSPVLARPARLRVRRVGRRLALGWARVPGAARYEVAVTFSSGRQRFATTRRRSVVLRGVSRGLGGRVTVRAVAALRQSRPSAARFRRAARRRTAMRPLPRCRGRGRARIVCTRR